MRNSIFSTYWRPPLTIQFGCKEVTGSFLRLHYICILALITIALGAYPSFSGVSVCIYFLDFIYGPVSWNGQVFAKLKPIIWRKEKSRSKQMLLIIEFLVRLGCVSWYVFELHWSRLIHVILSDGIDFTLQLWSVEYFLVLTFILAFYATSSLRRDNRILTLLLFECMNM